jgi:hypothetical protein
MALANDYFGLDVLGYDPYHQQKLDTLARYQTIDQLVGQQAQTGTPISQQTQSTATAPTQQPFQYSNTGVSGYGDLANQFMTAGYGGTYQPQSIIDTGGETGGDPRGGSPPTQPGWPTCPAGQYNDPKDGSCVQIAGSTQGCAQGEQKDANGNCVPYTGSSPCPAGQVKDSRGVCVPGQEQGERGGGCPRGMHVENNVCVPDNPEAPPRDTPTGTAINNIYTAGNIPPDIVGLRNALSSFLTQNFNSGLPAYGGNLNVYGSPYMDQAAGAAAGGLNTSNQYAGMFGNLANTISGQGPNNIGQGLLGAASGSLMGTMQGGNFQGIQSMMDAINAQGRGQLEDVGAQIREQYGAMGLGSGSDVAEAVARGQGRVISDMNVAKQGFAQNAWDAAMGRQLQAGSLAPGVAAGQQQPMNDYMARLLGLTGQIPGMTQATSGAGTAYGSLLAQLGMMDIGIQEGNINRQYGEFQRQTDPAYMNYALGLATGFPPNPNPKPVVQGGGTMSWLGPLMGTLGAAAIGLSNQSAKQNIAPYPTMFGVGMHGYSDREAKEHIAPFKGSVLAALRELQISSWQYKGEDTVHIGPMAQDMKRLFGVGDGKTIALIDVMGILMAAAKEMADAKNS